MPLLEILTYPNALLREPCEEVATVTDEHRRILKNMTATMYNAPGIGLAAAQVGCPYRLVVVDLGDREEGIPSHLFQLVNPRIVEKSEPIESEEGCLSLPDIRGTVPRFRKVVVEALDEAGARIRVTAEDLLARCFQHEIDHLDGVLFIDHMSRLQRELIKKRLVRQAKELRTSGK